MGGHASGGSNVNSGSGGSSGSEGMYREPRLCFFQLNYSSIGFAHGKVDPVEAGRMGGHASAGSNSNSSSGGSSGPGGNIFKANYICRD